jgi:adhesin/invasin
VHTIELRFASVPIRSNGLNGPYILDSLNFYRVLNSNEADQRDRAYQTFAYAVEQFFSVLVMGGLPDQLLETGATRNDAFNLRDFTVHRTLPISDVTYTILINTDPTVGVTIDAAGNIDINPPPDTEAESDVTIEAVDSLNNRVTSSFHISVQRARAAVLSATLPPSVGTNSTLPFSVAINDQFGRPYAQPVTVFFATTLGAVDPVSVTTSSAVANANLLSGNTPGVLFVTIDAGQAQEVLSVEVTPVAVASVTLAGPATGRVGEIYTFTATTGPAGATRPISYTWAASGFAPVQDVAELTSSSSYSWTQLGPQEVTTMVSNDLGSVQAVHTITLGPGAPAALTATATPASLIGDGNSTSTIRATVVDAFDNPTPNVEVAFATTLGSITPTALTGTDGVATALFTAGSGSGVATITASVAALDAEVTVTQQAHRTHLPLISQE